MYSSTAIRVATRYLWAKRDLSKALLAALPSLKNGDRDPAIQAILEVIAFFGTRETQGVFGPTILVDTEWLYALGKRDSERARDVMKLTYDIRDQLRGGKRAVESDIKAFEDLIAEIKWLDKKVHQPEHEFSYGDFTIVPMPGVSKKAQQACLAALDKAADAVRKRFPKLLYGKVFINKTLKSSHGVNAVASYVPGNDTIQLSLKAATTVGDVYALCHEFGHRFDHEFWKDQAQRNAFRDLSTTTEYEKLTFDKVTRAKLADEFLEIADAHATKKPASKMSPLLSSYLEDWFLRELRPLSQGYVRDPSEANRDALHKAVSRPAKPDIVIQTKNVLRAPLAVTPYGATRWPENFAEAFAHLCLGMNMPAEIAAIMNAL